MHAVQWRAAHQGCAASASRGQPWRQRLTLPKRILRAHRQVHRSAAGHRAGTPRRPHRTCSASRPRAAPPRSRSRGTPASRGRRTWRQRAPRPGGLKVSVRVRVRGSCVARCRVHGVARCTVRAVHTVLGACVLAVLARLVQLLREIDQHGRDGKREGLPVELAHRAAPARPAPLLVRLFIGDLRLCQILLECTMYCTMEQLYKSRYNAPIHGKH